MTQIIYTITLVNSDGTKTSASTPALEYPPTPSRQLQVKAEQTVNDLARNYTAMLAAIKNAITPAGKSHATRGR